MAKRKLRKQKDKMTENQLGFIRDRFIQKFEESKYTNALFEYLSLDDFNINENVERVGGISEEAHYIMRLNAQYFLGKTFDAMRINQDDPNVTEDFETGNI